MSDNIMVPGWGVFETFRFDVREVVKITAHMVTFDEAGKKRNAWRDKMVAILPDKASADKLAAQLTSVKAERDRRIDSARVWFAKEKGKLIAKAGMAA